MKNHNKSKNKNNKNNGNNSKKPSKTTSLIKLVAKEKQNTRQYEAEINEIQNIESRILEIQNSENNNETIKSNIEYYYLSQIEYELYLKNGQQDKIQAAIQNMWRACKSNTDIKYPFTFLGILYKASGNQAAALVCFFYSAKLSYDVQALNFLVEFYESDIAWLAKNPELVDGLKNLINEIGSISQNNSNNNHAPNYAIDFLASYDISSVAIQKIGNTLLSELISPRVYLNTSLDIDTINKIENIEKIIGNNDFNLYKDGKSLKVNKEGVLHKIGMTFLQDDKRIEAFYCFFNSVKKYSNSYSMLMLARFFKDGESWLPKNIPLAYTLYKNAIKKKNQSTYAYYDFSAFCYSINNYDEAIQAAEKCLNLNVDYIPCLYLLGNIYYSSVTHKNIEKAIVYFEHIIIFANKPEYQKDHKAILMMSLQILANIYLVEIQDYDIALKYSQQLLTLDKTSGDALLLQAQIYQKMGKIKHCEISLSLAEKLKASDIYYHYSELYCTGQIFDKDLNLAFEYAKKYIGAENHDDDKILSLYCVCSQLIETKLENEDLSEQEIDLLQKEKIQYLLDFLKIYDQLSESGKREKYKHVIYAYKNLASHFGDSDESLHFLDYTHKAALLGDVEAQYRLALFYFEKSSKHIETNNFHDALELTERSAHYFHLAGNQGMMKAQQYHDDINHRINFLKTSLSNTHNADDITKENDKNNQDNNTLNSQNIIVNSEPKINIANENSLTEIKLSAAKMFTRIKDKKGIWRQKQKKEMIFSSPSKPLLKTSDISWFNGSLKGTNPCLKPMVYTAGTNPAFFFVDYALLDKHKKNYGSNAASFYNNAQFRFHPSNVKKLKNNIKYPVKVQFPNGEIKEVECSHEWKLEGKSRMLVCKRSINHP